MTRGAPRFDETSGVCYIGDRTRAIFMCDYSNHTFGRAEYLTPDVRCVDGQIQTDTDQCDGPCPKCNTTAFINHHYEQVQTFQVIQQPTEDGTLYVSAAMVWSAIVEEAIRQNPNVATPMVRDLGLVCVTDFIRRENMIDPASSVPVHMYMGDIVEGRPQ